MFDGSKGMNVINFNSPNTKTSEDIHQEELDYEKEHGTQVAYTYIDPELMKQVLEDDDYYLCYEVVPVDKNNDMFNQLVFTNMITQATNLFGADSLQVDRLKKRFAQVMGEVFDDIFLGAQELEAKRAQAAAAAAINPNGGVPVDPGSKVQPVSTSFKAPAPTDQPNLNS